MKKRIFSILLSICMVLTMIPMAGGQVFAADEHKHCICGASHQAVGNHTDADEQVFTEWTATDSLPSDAGYYYLSDDVTITTQWEPTDGTVLCLNGHTIKTKATTDFDKYAISNSKVFTLTDCSQNGTGKIENALDSSKTASGIITTGNFYMYGGTITKYTGTAVYVNGFLNAFNMYGGSITGNTGVYGSDSGAGVHVWDGYVTVSGDVNITGNTKDGKANNVTLRSYNSFINPNGLADSARVGVTTGNLPTLGKPVTIASGDYGEEDKFNDAVGKIVPDDSNTYQIASSHSSSYHPTLIMKVIPYGTIVWETDGGKINDSTYTTEFNDGDTITAPADVTKTADAQYEYTFAGWSDTQGGTTPVDTFAPGAGTTTYYAIYNRTLRKYNVSWDTDGGSALSGTYTGENTDYGTVITAPDNPTKAPDERYSYKFEGWYTAKSGGQKLTADTTVTGNVTYYARYNTTPQSYNVTLDTDGGTLADGADVTGYTYGIRVTLPIPAKPGYKFAGWYNTDGNKVTAISSTDTGDKSFTAKWTPIPAGTPVITKQPKSLTFEYGKTGSFSIEAEAASDSTYTLSYQWYRNTSSSTDGGTEIAGATDTTYTVPDNTATGTYYYYCIVTAKRSDNGQEKTKTSDIAELKITKQAGRVVPPTAKQLLKYNGEAQVLLENAGSSDTGTIEYSLDNSTYSTDLPKGTEAGTYTVWYRVTGNDTYADVAPANITVDIAKAAGPEAPAGLNAAAPSKWGLSDGSITGVDSTMEYADNEAFTDAKDCTGDIIANLAAGTYYVRIKEATNYEAGKAAEVIVHAGIIEVESISVSSTGHKTSYEIGDALDVTGLQITAEKTDGNKETIDVQTDMVSGFDSSSAVDAQTLTITFGGKTTEYTIKIDKKSVEIPAADTTEFVYDGNAKTYTVNANEAYTVAGNVQTNAGEYTVTVSLNDTDKYRWSDGTATDKTYDFVINKAEVAKPELTENTFEYSGEDIVPAITQSKDKVTLRGGTSAKNTGNYSITVSLNDKDNYKWENSDNGDDINLSWSIAKAKLTVQPENVTIKQGDKLPTDMKLVFRGFKGEDNEESSITGPISDDDFEFLNEDGTALADTDTQGTYRIKFKNEDVLSSDNYDFEYVEGVLTVEKKTSDTYKPTQKPEIIAGEGVKAELRINGTKATITVEAGYEITDVLVNGVSIGKVTEITGLKTGDKVEIKTAKKQTEPEFNVKNYVKELTLAARSSKTAKGNIRIKVASVTDENGNSVDLSELKAKGYTVKYKFYRSEKKAAEYGARIEKDTDNNSYINNTGKKGAKYFYKVRVMVYDANGKLAAKSELKQCKYATRIWSK